MAWGSLGNRQYICPATDLGSHTSGTETMYKLNKSALNQSCGIEQYDTRPIISTIHYLPWPGNVIYRKVSHRQFFCRGVWVPEHWNKVWAHNHRFISDWYNTLSPMAGKCYWKEDKPSAVCSAAEFRSLSTVTMYILKIMAENHRFIIC